VGGYTKWAKTSDRSEATAPARQAFLDRFEREADPEGKLSPKLRAERAEAARKAYFARLSLKRWAEPSTQTLEVSATGVTCSLDGAVAQRGTAARREL